MQKIKPLKEVRRQHILRVLQSTGGDIQAAGRILGVSATDLHRLLREHGIPWDKEKTGDSEMN